LSGDIEREVERDLVTRFPQSLPADVLLVPHQGSRTSSRPVFLDRVSPGLALVASGYLNSYGHPHPEVMARYKEREIPVLNTANSGTITVSIRKDGIAWSEYRQARRKFWFR
jgi:competence protein ComEC